MIDGGATGIDVVRFMKDLLRGTKKAVKLSLSVDLAEKQRALIYARQKPSGGGQQKNAASTVRKKKGKAPMLDKGILSDPKQWITRKRGDAFALRPPPSRKLAVWVNAARGYDTVFQGLPSDFNDMLQARLDENLKNVEAKAKRRAKRTKGK